MNKKYELLSDDTVKTASGITLYRIKALIAIGLLVSSGDLGGYIESEKNLSQDDNAWVSGNARVSGDAWVSGNARVSDNAWVSGNARVYDNAWVSGNARVSGDAWVSGNARVSGDAWVSDNAWVYGNAAIVWFSNVGRENGTLTVFKGENGLIVTRGCFCGSIDEFLESSNKKHNEKIKREYQLLIEVAKSRIGD